MSDTQSLLTSGEKQSVTAGWMTIPEFARDINRTPRTVRRFIDRGMPVIRIGSTPYIDPLRARKWFEDGMPGPQTTRRRRAA